MTDHKYETWDDFMSLGFGREDKLVVIYNLRPHLLTPEYFGIIKALFDNKILREKIGSVLPELLRSVERWESGDLQEEVIGTGFETLSQLREDWLGAL